jgi:hypothetical protein
MAMVIRSSPTILFLTNPKEAPMLYKTIVLQLLEDHPQLRDRFQKYHQMLPTLEFYAETLKTGHETWTERLLQARPESDPTQIASEAMELAIAGLEARLPAESRADDETLFLDEAMTFLERPSSNE